MTDNQSRRSSSAPPPGSSHPEQLRLQPGHLYRAAGLAFLFLYLFRFLEIIEQTVLLVFASAIVAVALNPIARYLPGRRSWVAGLIGLAMVASIGLFAWILVPKVMDQLRELIQRAPELRDDLLVQAEWLHAETGINIPALLKTLGEFLLEWFEERGTEGLLFGVRGVLAAVLFPFIIVLGGLYALASPNVRLLTPLMSIVPRERRPAYDQMFQLLGKRISGWIRGRLIAMGLVGLMAAGALFALGVPFWLLLAVIIGVLEFIPIIGPWLGGIPAVILALLVDPMMAVWTTLAIVVIQQIESYLITPWAMSETAEIHPLITLFSLILFGGMFGFMGLLLSLPIVIVIWTIVEVLWVQETLESDGDKIRPVVKE